MITIMMAIPTIVMIMTISAIIKMIINNNKKYNDNENTTTTTKKYLIYKNIRVNINIQPLISLGFDLNALFYFI